MVNELDAKIEASEKAIDEMNRGMVAKVNKILEEE